MTCCRLLFTLCVVASSNACSSWSGERYEARTAELIDARLDEGMSIGEFETAFPTARRLEIDGTAAMYLISEQVTCFRCSSWAAFKRSSDVFARAVYFRDGRLVAVEPAPELPDE